MEENSQETRGCGDVEWKHNDVEDRIMPGLFGGGSTKTTTIIQPAPASAEEIALQAKQLELATFQLSELQRQSELQASFVSSLSPLIKQQEADAERAVAILTAPEAGAGGGSHGDS